MKQLQIALICSILLFKILLTPGYPHSTLTPQNLFDINTVVEVRISPDKSQIAYILNVPRPFTERAGIDYRELHLYNVRSGQSTLLIGQSVSISSLCWTPDGKSITFRASFPDHPGVQVYAFNPVERAMTQLTKHTGSINAYEFIDQNTLAIVSMSGKGPKQSQLMELGFDIEIYEEEFRHLNLYRYDLTTHRARQLTDGVTIFDFVLSPDKKLAAAAVAPRSLEDDFYMFKRIYTINMQTGELQLLVNNPGKLGNMVWSPDGKRLAFRSASKLDDPVSGSLFVAPVPNGKSFTELRNYVQGMELSVIDIAWRDDMTLLYAAQEGVDIVLSEHRIDRPAREILIPPALLVFNSFHHVDGLIAMAGNTWQHPSELYTFNLRRKNLQRHTNHNPWLSEINLGRQTKIVYNARDGKEIQGVLVYPLNFEEGKQYPLIVYIHCGHESAVKNGWSTDYNTWGQIAGARSYFVFMPNYRSSSGRGVDFSLAGYGNLVGAEYDDVITGIDHLIKTGYVDKDRVGIGGGSYGGFFSAWSATRHSDRFAAAVVFAGISNQISQRNTTNIPWKDYYVRWGYWIHENWQDVYSRSPVKYARHSQTPTLLLHGTDDTRVHPSQALELHRALKLHGKAPVRLILYKGEMYGLRINVHRLDYIVRTMEWFDYYLNPYMPKERMPAKYPDYGVSE